MQIRLRQDLLFFRRDGDVEPTWVVKDPLSFEHFLFSHGEHFLLRQLDGLRTEEEIVLGWREKFKTGSLSINQLRQFVKRLVQDNLVVVDQLGFGNSIFTQQHRRQQLANGSWWKNPLAIRLRGINPTGLLQQLDGLGRFLFHPVTVCTCMFASVAVLFYIFGHFEDVAERVPAMQQLLSSRGLIGLVVTISIVKVLHELGHALACRRFGGECHEIGVILLALIPTLYCNVSDAWTFKERWQRMMVSFAGMYVEICLAAIASVVWLLTPPSLFNALMFNVVVLCSINTLLINGNPLLRYDGYYLLADWWEKPNLSTLANEAVSRFWLSAVFIPRNVSSGRTSLLIYGMLSLVYRWFVLLAILSAIVFMAGRAGSYPLGYLTAGFLLAGFFMSTVLRNVAMVRAASRVDNRHWLGVSLIRTIAVATGAVGVSWFLFFIPLPCSVYCDAVVEARNPLRVYAANDGRLVFAATNYVAVEPGNEIVRLENLSLNQVLQAKQNEMDRQSDLLRELRLRLNQEPALASQINSLNEKTQSLAAEKVVIENEIDALTIVAPIAGVVFPAPASSIRFVDDKTPVRWQGFINDAKNAQCFVSRGEHLLTLCSTDDKIVSLIVDESDVELVTVGQSVRIRFEQLPEQSIGGTVEEILKQDLGLSNRWRTVETQSMAEGRGNRQLTQTPYRVEVGDMRVPGQVFLGSTGRAKISVGPQTVVQRIIRLLKNSLATRM